jgi:mannosyltransferase
MKNPAAPGLAFDESSIVGHRQHTPRLVLLLVVMTLATGLRFWKLGQLSFWYDEVVTMRLAEAPSPAELIHRLFEIDATRAPLHPLLLQTWLRLFGSSEAAGRAFSVLCGIATVGLVFWIGRMVFEAKAGLWAAYLAALSPPLVYYSREARMYAWLVMVTCVAWGLLFSLRQAGKAGRLPSMIAYSLSLTALLYSHPLGLLMTGTLALGSLCYVRPFFGTCWLWLGAHLVPLVLAAPWLSHYFDHRPEFLSGPLPIKFLIGTPIGFIGGNFLVLLGLCVMIGIGLVRRRRALAQDSWLGPVCLTLWLIVPPSLLYAYSWIGSPVFGPSRYTLFVAPAFLILVAQGLAMLPSLTSLTVGIALSLLAVASLIPSVYAPDMKADWRALAKEIRREMRSRPGTEIRVVVQSSDPDHNVEIETARYYLPAGCRVIDMDEFSGSTAGDRFEGVSYLAIGIKAGAGEPSPDELCWVRVDRHPGLAVYWWNPTLPPPRPAAREPGAPGG